MDRARSSWRRSWSASWPLARMVRQVVRRWSTGGQTGAGLVELQRLVEGDDRLALAGETIDVAASEAFLSRAKLRAALATRRRPPRPGRQDPARSSALGRRAGLGARAFSGARNRGDARRAARRCGRARAFVVASAHSLRDGCGVRTPGAGARRARSFRLPASDPGPRNSRARGAGRAILAPISTRLRPRSQPMAGFTMRSRACARGAHVALAARARRRRAQARRGGRAGSHLARAARGERRYSKRARSGTRLRRAARRSRQSAFKRATAWRRTAWWETRRLRP